MNDALKVRVWFRRWHPSSSRRRKYRESPSRCYRNCSSALPAVAGSNPEAAALAGNTLPVVVAAGSNPSAVLAGRDLAVGHIDPEEDIGPEEGSWDPEEDSHLPAGDSSRLVLAAGECRSRCRQPEEAEAGRTGVDLACRTLCLRCLRVVMCRVRREG